MIATAEVVVIGGGVNGCSIAYHLAKSGVKDVVLVEKGHVASGPTGRSSGIIRQHYSIETLARMARDSVRVFQTFAESVGGDAGFVQTGAAFICAESEAGALRTTVEMQQRLGIRASMISRDELLALEPKLSLDGIAQGAYEPDAGYADPSLTANGFAEAAQREGATIMKRTEVTGLRVEAGAITAVLTSEGEISTRTVVNVAGPWGGDIASMAGVTIPIYATRHPVVILQRPANWQGPTPVILDIVEGWYYKPERHTGLMVGSMENSGEDQKANIDSYSTSVGYDEIESYSAPAMKRYPPLSEGTAHGGWAGLYDMTPDAQPVLDRIPEVKGFHCAIGFSGHGFKLAPAVGTAMTEIIQSGECHSYDLAPLRASRFGEGKRTNSAYRYGIVG